jgi:hypothetical protein
MHHRSPIELAIEVEHLIKQMEQLVPLIRQGKVSIDIEALYHLQDEVNTILSRY